MWDKIKLAIGILWASPITLVVLLYILPLWILGHYQYRGWNGVAWRWVFNPNKTKGFIGRILLKRWARWGGHAGGNIIVLKTSRFSKSEWSETTEIHENEHIVQCMRMGIFQPIHYFSNFLVAKFVLRNADPYYDNIYEIDARRAANQLIDISGTLRRLKEEKAKKDGAV